MTRLERKEAELHKLYQYREAARKQNALMWLSQNESRIDALEKEVIAMRNENRRRLEESRRNAVMSLKDLLESKGEDVKNRFYVGMMRISMLADVVNEATAIVRDMMKDELKVVDFSLRKEVDDMHRLSQKISGFMLQTGSPILEDAMVDNERFVDACMRLATKHITSKLKIKTK